MIIKNNKITIIIIIKLNINNFNNFTIINFHLYRLSLKKIIK